MSKSSSALHPLDQHDGHRRRAGDREAQRAQVVVLAGRVVEQRLVDRRRAGQHGDALLGDRPHRLLGVERQLRDQRRAGLQAGQDAGLVAEVVEERVDAQVAVGAGELAALGPRRGRRQRLPVRAQHALAAAGRAGGEQDVGRRRRGAPPRRGRRPRTAVPAGRPGTRPRCRRSASSRSGSRTTCRSAGSAARSRSATRSAPRKRPIAISSGASVRARMSAASSAV